MATGLETAAARAAGRALTTLTKAGRDRLEARRARADSRAPVSSLVAVGALKELSAAELGGLEEYLGSPEFDEVAVQTVLARGLRDKPAEELRSAIREQVRAGLRLKIPGAGEKLLGLTDVCCDALVIECDAVLGPRRRLDATAVAAAAPLVAAAVSNGRLLGRVTELAKVYDTAERLRYGIARRYADIRLPHAGISRKVPYAKLYVEPPLVQTTNGESRSVADMLGPGRRGVVLGAPGAGKSSLLAKLAHDIANDRIESLRDRVPFLVVLRDFAQAFAEGGRSLLDHLERLARDPFNVHPPADAVEYLLRNGRGVVLLDGLDELVDQGLRRRVVELIEGFVDQYPLVPVLATARAIGYSAVPLDPGLFETYEIGDFTDEHVAAYARLWFLQDEATAPEDRERITESFVTDSALAGSLRHSPLLLSLLCAMYSSARYIPRNLAQVYERCAVMLFDEWDTMRGIAMPMQFQGRLRAAVQYLAWRQLTATQADTAMPRSRVLGIMAEYLRGKKLDADDAAEASEGFLDFCTGRAWILADVGSTDRQSTYDFTHRTFMEFFAAEHLVRTHDNGPALWRSLRERIESGDWDVVGQVCLQLLDRNQEDGAEEFLEALMADYESQPAQGRAWLRFAGDALGFVVPSPGLVDRIVRAAFDAAAELDLEERHPFWITDEAMIKLNTQDTGLEAVLSTPPMEGNVAFIRRTLLKRAEESMAQQDEGAIAVLHGLLGVADLFPGLSTILPTTQVEQLREELDSHGHPMPTIAFKTHPVAAKIGAASGPGALYRRGGIFGQLWYPAALSRELFSSAGEAEALSDYLIGAPRPWIDAEPWADQHDRFVRSRAGRYADYFGGRFWSSDMVLTEAKILTFLPYLETATSHAEFRDVIERYSKDLAWLISSRSEGAPPPRLLASALRPQAQEFLWAWIESRVSTVGQRRQCCGPDCDQPCCAPSAVQSVGLKAGGRGSAVNS